MTAQQLKNSILQLAIQGKLVPQDPNDEPASVLLERIRQEKENLVKQGKIKRDKNPSVIFRGADNITYEKTGLVTRAIDDELPFEIPESWAWARLVNFCNVVSAKRVLQEDWQTSGIPFYRAREIAELADHDKVDNELFISLDLYDKIKQYGLPKPNDLMVTAVGTLGKVYIVKSNDKFYYKDASVICFEKIGNCCSEYLKLIIQSSFIQKQIKDASSGTTVGTITIQNAKKFIFPIPPLAEQRRIVSKIETLLPLVESYGERQVELDDLNATFPEALKKSILQEAIQGRLVEQDPNDEPASVLLERIRKEKERLIKLGKIKRDKKESVIYKRSNSQYVEQVGDELVCIDDEIPFEIPESWMWVRLNSIGVYRKGPFGSSLTKSMFVPKDKNTIKVYEQKNAIYKDHTLGDYYITREYFQNKMSSFEVKPGDIIVSCAGTIGETYVLPEDIQEGIINQALMRMTIFSPINIEFFLTYFDYALKRSAREHSKGSAIKNIPPFEVFKRLLLPLPPLDEQQRIVVTLKGISKVIDNLF